MARPRENPGERFWAKVGATDSQGCWPWLGHKLPDTGHARFWLDGRTISAYRFGYELLIGPIPDGLVIDHLCRNPQCVNPKHLEPVTSRENTLRGLSLPAQHAAKTHCKQGHPFDATNTHWYLKRGIPVRRCRACDRETMRRLRERRRACSGNVP